MTIAALTVVAIVGVWVAEMVHFRSGVDTILYLSVVVAFIAALYYLYGADTVEGAVDAVGQIQGSEHPDDEDDE